MNSPWPEESNGVFSFQFREVLDFWIFGDLGFLGPPQRRVLLGLTLQIWEHLHTRLGKANSLVCSVFIFAKFHFSAKYRDSRVCGPSSTLNIPEVSLGNFEASIELSWVDNLVWEVKIFRSLTYSPSQVQDGAQSQIWRPVGRSQQL